MESTDNYEPEWDGKEGGRGIGVAVVLCAVIILIAGIGFALI